MGRNGGKVWGRWRESEGMMARKWGLDGGKGEGGIWRGKEVG